jgi:hypothetical protein
MTDPLKGLYTQKRYFKAEYEDAGRRLAHLGGKLEPGVHDYQAFTFTMPGLRLVFYPHKTSASNYHLRVRTEGKAEEKLLREAFLALKRGNIGCNFGFPKRRDLEELFRHEIYGWQGGEAS